MSSIKSSDIASVRPKIRSKHSEKLIGEPLERRTIRFEDRDGIERYYPALHIRFSHTMVFTKYLRPPMETIADLHLNGRDLQNNQHIQRWIANVGSFEDMLKTLLRLQHNHFWSTLIYEKSLQICLESYLRFAPRDHDLQDFLITDQMKIAVKRVHNLLFKLYVRICSIQESKANFISETTFGNLIYDNHLIDVPKMVDLSVLYANSDCRHLLMRMLSDVIRCQPRYLEELFRCCANMSEAINSIQQRLGFDENQIETNGNKFSYIQWSELQSMVSHITDISVSLQTLLLSVPQMADFYRTALLDKTIVQFYSRVFPSLQKEMDSRFLLIENNDLIVDRIKKQILISRSNLLQTFRHVIKTSFLDKLMDYNLNPESKVCLIDELIETLTFASFERSFINDYCNQFPIEKDFDELSKHCELTQFETCDKTRIDYLKSLIESSISCEPNTSNTSSLCTNDQNNDYSKSEGKVNEFVNNEEINGLDIELESSIQYIREIMPELGSGFVEKCLEYYSLDNEKVLNAILENNLPIHLSQLDRNLQKVPKKQLNENPVNNIEKEMKDKVEYLSDIPVPQVIDQRDNVYNNDEFDIFRNKSVDLSRIRLGKKERVEPKLDDKTKEKIMSIHLKALEDEENDQFCQYNDEYDDTYEDNTKIDLPNDKHMDELDNNRVDANSNDNNGSKESKPKDIPHKQRAHYNNNSRNYNKSRNYR